MDLEQALGQFERTQTNLKRLESVWQRMQQLIPDGIVFPGSGPNDLLYDDLARSFAALADGLPSIDGTAFDARPMPLTEVAQNRLAVQQVDEPDAMMALEEHIAAPSRAIADYRHRLNAVRKNLVRERVAQLISEIDAVLVLLAHRYERTGSSVRDDSNWQQL